MAIQPTKPGGYGPGQVPTANEFAAIDKNLATYGINSVQQDSVYGTLSVKQSPYSASVPWVQCAGHVRASAAGALIQTVNGSGGRIVLMDNDVPLYSANRTRTVRMSLLEARTFVGTRTIADPSGTGITEASTGASSTYHLPLTKPHDGALLNQITIWFFFSSDPGTTRAIGAAMGVVNASGALVTGAIGGPASTAESYSGGAVQSLSGTTAAGTYSNVINVQLYDYVLQINSASSNVTLTAVDLAYTTIGSEAFTQ